MKVAIVGMGFVGTALEKSIHKNIDVIKIDPKLGSSISDLNSLKIDIIFLCLPTPMLDNGDQNIDIVLKVLNEVNKYQPEADLVLKSTVLPEFCKKISDENKNFVYNPEFLRENFAYDDFINSKIIIFGGENETSKRVASFYKNHTLCIHKDYIFTDAITASLIKYTINSYLASKVIFFNEINKIFKKSGANDSWENFINAVSSDPRIGSSHMSVPGKDNKYGFGGACFPKDTSALYNYSKSLDSEFKLLKEAISINNSIRSRYNTITEREKEQNINYNNKKEKDW